VRIDPHLTLLAKINFKPARPMLFAQLTEDGDIIGQLLALDQLAEKPDKEAVGKIRSVLQSAKHYGVRSRAAEVLAQAHSDEALAALIESTTQVDARVRNGVVKALGGYYDKASLKALMLCCESEKNPGIQATALSGLAAYQTPEVREVFSRFLRTPSYHDRLCSAAVGAIKAQDDPAMLGPVLELLQKRSKELPSNVIGACLETIGALQRRATDKDSIRELLLSHVNHPREQVRVAAINGLGNLEDPRAAAVLETFKNMPENKPEKGAAEKALDKIRNVQKPNEELKELRSEISALRDAGRELKKEVETLRKKFDPKP
jgi:aminopeptidase N